MEEDLYTAYHAVSENEEIVADRDVDISGGIRAFSDVMKRQGIKQDGDELYEEFQRIYEENVSRDADKEKVEDRMQNSGSGRGILCSTFSVDDYMYGFENSKIIIV